MESQKKAWLKPELSEFGNVEAITLQTTCPDPCKQKTLGGSDDFGINGITAC